MYDISDQV